jgi:hypothetical protein
MKLQAQIRWKPAVDWERIKAATKLQEAEKSKQLLVEYYSTKYHLTMPYNDWITFVKQLD